YSGDTGIKVLVLDAPDRPSVRECLLRGLSPPPRRTTDGAILHRPTARWGKSVRGVDTSGCRSGSARANGVRPRNGQNCTLSTRCFRVVAETHQAQLTASPNLQVLHAVSRRTQNRTLAQ